jgi:hypothetical protein
LSRTGASTATIPLCSHASSPKPSTYLLETTLGPGTPFPTPKHPHLKRFLLSKSRCHIYFEMDEPKQMIRILHVWHGQRERPPKL